MNELGKFWNEFINKTMRSLETKYIEAFHFELTEYWANELLRMVLTKKKTATASSLYSFQLNNEKVPQVGDLNIITDWNGTPKCVIETTQIRILPFKDITYDICKREGEDECLDTWQDGHIKFFTAEGNSLGYLFTDDMPVVFEDFKVIYEK